MKLTSRPLPTTRRVRNHGGGALWLAAGLVGPAQRPATRRPSDAARRQSVTRSERSTLSIAQSVTVRLITSDQILSLTLDDYAAAWDFRSLLPLELVLTDYYATEKVADLPRRLTTDGAPDGVTPAAGDFAYYAP